MTRFRNADIHKKRELDFVKTVKKAWTQLPGMDIFEAIEWRDKTLPASTAPW